MSKPIPPLVITSDNGRLADGSDSGGTLAISIGTQTPGGWIPPYVHHAEEEAWYVLEGTLTFRFGGEERDAPAGTFVLVPRGNAHCFGNNTDAPARFLMLFTPSGMEGFFEEMDRVAAAGGGYSSIPRDRMVEIARPHHMEFVGEA
jgi:quercetin dioxygenase-like cupin family protein